VERDSEHAMADGAGRAAPLEDVLAPTDEWPSSAAEAVVGSASVVRRACSGGEDGVLVVAPRSLLPTLSPERRSPAHPSRTLAMSGELGGVAWRWRWRCAAGEQGDGESEGDGDGDGDARSGSANTCGDTVEFTPPPVRPLPLRRDLSLGSARGEGGVGGGEGDGATAPMTLGLPKRPGATRMVVHGEMQAVAQAPVRRERGRARRGDGSAGGRTVGGAGLPAIALPGALHTGGVARGHGRRKGALQGVDGGGGGVTAACITVASAMTAATSLSSPATILRRRREGERGVHGASPPSGSDAEDTELSVSPPPLLALPRSVPPTPSFLPLPLLSSIPLLRGGSAAASELSPPPSSLTAVGVVVSVPRCPAASGTSATRCIHVSTSPVPALHCTAAMVCSLPVPHDGSADIADVIEPVSTELDVSDSSPLEAADNPAVASGIATAPLASTADPPVWCTSHVLFVSSTPGAAQPGAPTSVAL